MRGADLEQNLEADDLPVKDRDGAAGGIFREVNALAACVNALSIIAAPIVLMRCRKEAEKGRDGALDLSPQFDEYVAVVELMSASRRAQPDGEQHVALASRVRAIRDAMAAKSDLKNNVDRSIIEAARAALLEFGMAAPPEGWDAHRGPMP